MWPTWEKAWAEIGRGCQEDNPTNDKRIERGNWEMEKDGRAGEGETRGPFQIRACDGVAEGPKPKLEGIRLHCAGMSVNLSEKQKANGRFWLGFPEGQDKCPA